jgi:hypothetical protein
MQIGQYVPREQHRLASSGERAIGDRIGGALDRESRSVTIAGCGGRARSADLREFGSGGMPPYECADRVVLSRGSVTPGPYLSGQAMGGCVTAARGLRAGSLGVLGRGCCLRRGG